MVGIIMFLWLILAVATCGIHGFSFGSPGKRPLKRTQLRATWSDSKAVKEYQDFLSSGKQEIEMAADCPSVIIRSPEMEHLSIVDGIYHMGSGNDLVLTPDQPLPPDIGGNPEYPIYIALRPWEIKDFLVNLGETYRERNEDFIFLSGGLEFGNIEDLLKETGYCRETMTQFLASGLRVTPTKTVQDLSSSLGTDNSGIEKRTGACASCGKWAGAIAERLERNNIRCKAEFYREWRRKMWERSVFDAVFNLLGAVREQPTSLGDVGNYYGEEASDMVWELSQLLRGWRALTLTYGFEERLFGIAETTSHDVPTQLMDEMYPYVWGNQVFLESQPFTEYLAIAKSDRGLLSTVELPKRAMDSYKSNMRQGNLRADGVV